MISEDESSEDDFLENAIQFVARHRIFRDRSNPFEIYNELDFKMRFRFTKESVVLILQHFEEELTPFTARNFPISPMNQLLCTLRFYATGSFQNLLGDNINISKASVSRIIKKVTHLIALLKRSFINMPSPVDRHNIKGIFFRLAGFPGVIGALDCTHIRIQSPGGIDAERFRNRKGYFSINVQAICDADLNFLNIIARWPGSVHDSTIFNDSPIKNDFEAGLFQNCYLLGDNGYPCRNYLLTPLINPRNEAEQNYNRSHITTRNTIERAFGVVKRRFPCLSIGLRTKLSTTLAVIVACFTLHNMAKQINDEEPFVDVNIQIPADAYDVVPLPIAIGNRIINQTAARTALINTRFN